MLGLATGSTPVPVYERLVAMHKGGELSFSGVSTFNLDEYYPISPADPRSYRSYMDRHLFRHVDLAANRTHMLDGTVPEALAAEHAALFDRMIAAEGGLDFQLPRRRPQRAPSGSTSRRGEARRRGAEAADEAGRAPPRHAGRRLGRVRRRRGRPSRCSRRRCGVAPILGAARLDPRPAPSALREGRAAGQGGTTGPMTAEVPASLLQSAAGRVTWMVDEAAAAGLACDRGHGDAHRHHLRRLDPRPAVAAQRPPHVDPAGLLASNRDDLFLEFRGRP